MVRWQNAKASGQTSRSISDFVNPDATRISWSRALKQDVRKGKDLDLNDGQFVRCMYRPFTKQWQFYSRRLNEYVSQMPRIFPDGELPNRVIAVTGRGGRSGFSALMMDALPDFQTIYNGQCFPMWLYEENEPQVGGLLRGLAAGTAYRRREAITDAGVEHFRMAWPGESITHEDIFHYVYGLLHSEDFRSRFAANLVKDLPRIPCVRSLEDYRAFRDAGRKLGELHVGYEAVDPCPDAVIDTGGARLPENPEIAYRVTGMKHPGRGKTKDRSTVIYNNHITIREIPDAAWDYVVNGKPALSWVMERQCVKTDKASSIVSDANRYAVETVGDPRYPLDLFLRMITVSLETLHITRSLPALSID